MYSSNSKATSFIGYNSYRKETCRKYLCYAPFRSLRFSLSGHVLACCFNRGYSLGKYPEDTLNHMWFGEKLKKLQESILNNDLSLGCSECHERIQNNLFELSGSLQYDYLASYPESTYPQLLDFELSNTCNLKCLMCTGENSSQIRAERDNLPSIASPYDKAFVEQLKEFIPPLKEARFSGGEPFLIPIYYEIWKLILDINPLVNISVLTNATILNDTIKELLEKGNFQISVSIDSLTKETYENIRQNANFETVTEHIDYFYNYSQKRNKNFCFNVCPSRHNWKEIPSIVNYCNKKNIQLVLHTLIFPPSEALWPLSSNILEKIDKEISSEKIISTTKISKKNIKTFEHFKAQIKRWLKDSYTNEEKTIFLKNKTEEALLSLLKTHIYHKSDYYYNKLYPLLLSKEINSDARKNIVIQLLLFRPELIIAEILHSDTERLIPRLKMLNY